MLLVAHSGGVLGEEPVEAHGRLGQKLLLGEDSVRGGKDARGDEVERSCSDLRNSGGGDWKNGRRGALLPGELKRGKGIHGREEKQRRPRQGTTRWWLLLGSSEDEGSRGDRGAFGIGWRRKPRRRGSRRIPRKKGVGRLAAETGWMDWTRVRLFI